MAIKSLEEIRMYVQANSEINQNTQLAIVLYNKVVSVS